MVYICCDISADCLVHMLLFRVTRVDVSLDRAVHRIKGYTDALSTVSGHALFDCVAQSAAKTVNKRLLLIGDSCK